MEVEEGKRGRRRYPGDVTVQVERGGVTRAVTGVLHRSAVAAGLSSRKKVRDHLVDAGRSLLAFVCGLLVASLYFFSGLLQNQQLSFCLHATVGVAGLAAFSMGLSTDTRASVALMLPSFCSGRGRSFVLLLYVTTLLSGPLANTLENTERAASSLLCGAELAANQTQELIQRSATPLFSALDQIKTISRNAYAVAGRVQNLIQSMMDSVRHVARTLRNVLRFLADIGDVCNDVLGSPYRKCRAVFSDARSDCADLLGDFSFLCGVLDGFLPLCSIARAGELFCVIPAYVAAHLKQRLAEPIVAAFQKLKREFEFNLTASVRLDVDANSSQSLQQVTQNIMEEISSDLRVIQKLGDPAKYLNLLLLAFAFIRAVQYRRRYLGKIDFDNIYISAQFKKFNEQETSRGGASVLPITRKEATIYITPMNLHLTDKERRAMLMGVVLFLRHLLVGVVLVALDFLVFWVLDQVHHQVTGDVVARALVTVAVQVNGSGYASDIYRDLAASFNVLQQGNITVVSRKCVLEPSEPDQHTCFILGILLGVSLLITLTAGFVQRSRRLICASFYPERELERMLFLRQQILQQREVVGTALRRSAIQRLGRGGGGRRRLQALLKWLPGGARLSHLLGVSSPASCLLCGEAAKPEDSNTVTCNIPQCSGLYCRPCFQSVGNTCVACTQRPTFQDDSEEELDSSDDEQQESTAALRSPRLSDNTQVLMESGVSMATQWGPPSRGALRGGRDSDSELSEEDMSYQDRPGTEESDSRSDQDRPGTEESDSRSDQDRPGTEESDHDHDPPSAVLVHTPEPLQSLQNLPGP